MSDRNKVFEKHLMREKLLTALESGEVKQQKCGLHNRNFGGFCFIGLSYELSGLGEWEPDASQWPIYRIGKLECSGWTMSMPVARKYGLNRNATRKLVDWNDRGRTFKEIAAEIRAHPERYFVDE